MGSGEFGLFVWGVASCSLERECILLSFVDFDWKLILRRLPKYEWLRILVDDPRKFFNVMSLDVELMGLKVSTIMFSLFNMT